MRPINGRSGGAVVVFSATLLDGSVGDGGGVGGFCLIFEADFDRDCMRSRIDFDLGCMNETNSDSDWDFRAEGVVGVASGVAGGVGSVGPTVFERQSMGGLTRSSHGIPKIMEWEPIGATRKVSRCLTPAMVYDKVVCRVARVSNSPFARLTEVGMHGVVLRDKC